MKQMIPIFCNNVEKMEHLILTGRNVNYYSHYEKQYRDSSKNEK